ncbi:peptidoglycan D,D-transpeptidase FtsI family protein [Cohnella sp. JJ-181]|uniref:peptidoglycan D,D-transpeptidase FtsI family protein n=1 Tax=Cohnella rhizoplanae TaxID=2974897 RepID=UPI0022FF6C0D|nr:penicillin-binding transpeptidase domain-containing protein [Cohnella sp. JJ-181]CAI6015367.1 Penicillin-binding protein 4B [Cohnella sp. JJ-181]
MSGLVPARIFKIMIVLAAAFGVAEARLAWVQLGGGGGRTEGAVAGLSQQAYMQHSDPLELDGGRGQFTDREGLPLTGRTVRVLAAYPTGGMPRGTDGRLRALAETLGARPEQVAGWLDGIREPLVWRKGRSGPAVALTEAQEKRIGELELTGVAVVPYVERYRNPAESGMNALHAIGYTAQDPSRMVKLYSKELAKGKAKTSDPIGEAGLELSLDRLLRGVGGTFAVATTDGARRPLAGIGIRISGPANPHYPLQVRTTIDSRVQQAAEAVLKKHGIKEGAVVILDADSADILGMVSLPAFDPSKIGAAGTDSRNHALIAVPPGSIFKTVTLAAALEAGVTTLDEIFRCIGTYGRYGLNCWLHGGHGVLTVKEAYAESCNVVFAALAERLDPAVLAETADKLGLGRQIGWQTASFVDGKPLRLLAEEQPGAVFASPDAGKDGGVRTGTGIGQRDVRVTPLQAANLAVTLLHGGRVQSPRIAREIRYADGGLLASMPERGAPSEFGSIKPATAAALREAMRAVVTEGTAGHALGANEWPLAGKSGTAELAGKRPALNEQWFIGYGPAKGRPRYAVSVLLENRKAGARNAAPAVFGDLMDALRLMEQAESGPPVRS